MWVLEIAPNPNSESTQISKLIIVVIKKSKIPSQKIKYFEVFEILKIGGSLNLFFFFKYLDMVVLGF
jgi:hypothetical protein